MRAMRLTVPAEILEKPLQITHLSVPEPGPGQLLLHLQVCGICHTDLHIVEGELKPPQLPLIPGHQVVGHVAAIGSGVQGWQTGDRAGVPWFYNACGTCRFCIAGRENLCPDAKFTGFSVDGGYAEYMLSEADSTLHLPETISDLHTAPLLCAGIIGYRSLKLSDLQPGERLGLVGFGASAHLVIQIALSWNCEVYVFTRSEGHRKMAQDLGASWVGGLEETPPGMVDRAILFAPAGSMVGPVLEKIRPASTLAINAVYMSPIPELDYALLYGERTIRSVSHAVYQDGVDLLEIACRIGLKPYTNVYPLEDANQALQDLKLSRINGAGVLVL
ncbi:MAG: zinc-dependent alcohol dehydrogenase family protein [Anaerolineales bacterium]|nr:zinc-dependent alcohol dehydrogenase family protein [Anaerolineales bacterium]